MGTRHMISSKMRSFYVAYSRNPGYRASRGQLRFGAFAFTMLFSLLAPTFAVLAVVVAVAARDGTGVLFNAVAALVTGAIAVSLWSIRGWWWPPIRREDRWRP